MTENMKYIVIGILILVLIIIQFYMYKSNSKITDKFKNIDIFCDDLGNCTIENPNGNLKIRAKGGKTIGIDNNMVMIDGLQMYASAGDFNINNTGDRNVIIRTSNTEQDSDSGIYLDGVRFSSKRPNELNTLYVDTPKVVFGGEIWGRTMENGRVVVRRSFPV